jgi:threonine/homoserine/homoserine lactone efflux protein
MITARKRLLATVLVAGLLDAVLLAVLAYVAFVHRDNAVVRVAGTVRGVNFLVLLAVSGYGALRRHWSWWFPLAVLITAGPLGSLAGDLYLRHQAATAPAGAPARQGHQSGTPRPPGPPPRETGPRAWLAAITRT